MASGQASRLTDPVLIRFAAVGALTTALDAIVFVALSAGAGWPIVGANVCSYSLGIVTSFGLNGAWTFSSFDNRAALVRQAVRFAASNLAGLILSTAAVATLAQIVPDAAAKLLSVPIVFVWNYAASRLWVFR